MPTRRQIEAAQLERHAERCAQLGLPVDKAAAALRQISAKPEVLAQAAGILAGIARQEIDYGRRITAARFLVAAGADCRHLPYWIGVGRYNATRPTGPGDMPDWPDDLDRVMADVISEA